MGNAQPDEDADEDINMDTADSSKPKVSTFLALLAVDHVPSMPIVFCIALVLLALSSVVK